MGGRKYLIAFLLLVIGWYLYFFQTPHQEEIAKTQLEFTAPHTIADNTKILETAYGKDRVNPNGAGAKNVLRTRKLSDLGLVPFKIEDGLAIAYGDIILGEPEGEEEEEGKKAGFYRPPRPQLWESSEIPYFISPELSIKDQVEAAIEYFHQNTPITFVPLDNQEDAIVFEPGSKHCYSYLGKIGGHQPIRLSNKCRWNEIVHEIMHALGFIHEHSRTDRDKYVQIMWDNIDEEREMQFAIVPADLMETVRGTKFDYESIMLYGRNTFARRSGLVTMHSLTSQPISPAKGGLSKQDIERLNYLYGH